jgi:hypothetical protein
MTRGPVIIGAGGLAAASATLAAIGDAGRSGPTAWMTVADVTTGLAFVASAVATRSASRERYLTAAVGVAWLIGSWLPRAASLHQGVLIVALLGFPAGKLGSSVRRIVAVFAVPVALGVDIQLGVAGVFLLVAVVTVSAGDHHPIDRWFPAGVSAACASLFGTFGLLASYASDAVDPSLTSLTWEAVLTTIALGFPLAASASGRAATQRTEWALDEASSSGLDDLAVVLGAAVGDRQLRWQRMIVTAADFSDDGNHPSVTGMAHRAEVTWAALQAVGLLPSR